MNNYKTTLCQPCGLQTFFLFLETRQRLDKYMSQALPCDLHAMQGIYYLHSNSSSLLHSGHSNQTLSLLPEQPILFLTQSHTKPLSHFTNVHHHLFQNTYPATDSEPSNPPLSLRLSLPSLTFQPRLPLPSCPPLPGRPVREARKSRTHPSKARLLQKASFAAISFVMCAVRHALSCMASVLYYGWSHARVALFDLHAAPEAQEAQGLFGCLGRQTCTQRPVLLSYPPHLQIPRFCSYCSQQAHLFASFISSFIPVLKKKPENRHPRKIKKTLQESEATLNKKLLQSPSLDSPSLWSTSLTVFGF